MALDLNPGHFKPTAWFFKRDTNAFQVTHVLRFIVWLLLLPFLFCFVYLPNLMEITFQRPLEGHPLSLSRNAGSLLTGLGGPGRIGRIVCCFPSTSESTGPFVKIACFQASPLIAWISWSRTSLGNNILSRWNENHPFGGRHLTISWDRYFVWCFFIRSFCPSIRFCSLPPHPASLFSLMLGKYVSSVQTGLRVWSFHPGAI